MQSQSLGRWTQLFGRATSFQEDADIAQEIGAEIRLFDISKNQPGLSYVQIIMDEIPGWEEPLWASDAQWLYLRRPQGVWKTKLPIRHLDRVGVVYQKRSGAAGVFGGTQLGQNFANHPVWRLMNQERTPEEIDVMFGFAEDGSELGPLISDAVEVSEDRVVLQGGPIFGSMPESCVMNGRHIFVDDGRGRIVKFILARGIDLSEAHARGVLWLRFAGYDHSWVDPIDIKVS